MEDTERLAVREDELEVVIANSEFLHIRGLESQLERTGILGVVIEAYEFELICILRADVETSELTVGLSVVAVNCVSSEGLVFERLELIGLLVSLVVYCDLLAGLTVEFAVSDRKSVV